MLQFETNKQKKQLNKFKGHLGMDCTKGVR